MSTYEARAAYAARRRPVGNVMTESVVTPERIEAGVRHGRRERSLAMWSMLQSVFGRPEARDQHEKEIPVSERTPA